MHALTHDIPHCLLLIFTNYAVMNFSTSTLL